MSELARYPILQSKVIIVKEDQLSNYAELMITGVEKNSANSIANMIRRTSYNNTIGSSIVGIKIKGITSEFDTLAGLLEDINQVIFNIKNLVIQSNIDNIKGRTKLCIQFNKIGSIYGFNIECPKGIKILNPDIKICTLTEPIPFYMDIFVQSGTGYFEGSQFEKGIIPINGSFCPIEHFSYQIKSFPHYEDIMIHIRTNGSITPLDTFYHAVEFLATKFNQLLYD